MNATIVDLRYKTKEILQALDRRETVNILYHGKLKGKIVPSDEPSNKALREHPFFSMRKGEKESVEEVMKRLRSPRRHGL